MRTAIVVTSIIGLISTGILILVILGVSNAWGSKPSVSLAVLGGLVGFASCAVAAIKGYHQDWYKPVALLGSVFLVVSSSTWLQGRDQLPGVYMIGIAALVAIDAFKNH